MVHTQQLLGSPDDAFMSLYTFDTAIHPYSLYIAYLPLSSINDNGSIAES